jgi:hypothetical protein
VRKIISAICCAFVLSTASYAYDLVPCATYLHNTMYAHAVDRISKRSFFILRSDIKKGVSNEEYILLNGKTVQAQSRVMPNKPFCAAYEKENGHYVQYAYYKIYKRPQNYGVHMFYKNGDRQN